MRSLGPDERFGIGVVKLQIVSDGLLQFARGSMRTTAKLFFGQSGKPAFDLVEPLLILIGCFLCVICGALCDDRK